MIKEKKKDERKKKDGRKKTEKKNENISKLFEYKFVSVYKRNEIS